MPDPLNELREQFTRRLVDRTFGIWTEPTVADSIWAKVAPLIREALADAWDAGYEAGHEDARAVQATYPQSTPNPYRERSWATRCDKGTFGCDACEHCTCHWCYAHPAEECTCDEPSCCASAPERTATA